MSTGIINIFIKNPRLGYVKTRLAATLGDEEALRIYRFLLDKTRAAVVQAHAKCWLWYSDTIAENDDWDGAHFHKKVQVPGDLGERMYGAFQAAFAEGATKVIIVGSDCPELNGDILDQALEALEHHDFVVGPTPDGGYYLLGMNQLHQEVFQNIAWSTDAVYPTTAVIIKSLGCTKFDLAPLSDIDNETDWINYQSRQNLRDAS
jgi:uncharacterized protein